MQVVLEEPATVHPPGSLAADMQAVADRVMARRSALRAAENEWYAKTFKPAERRSVDDLRAELAREEAALDPMYEYSCDYTFWKEHSDRALRIADLKAQIRAARVVS